MNISYKKRYNAEESDNINLFGGLILGMSFHDRGTKVVYEVHCTESEISQVNIVCLDPSNHQAEISSSDPYNTIAGLRIIEFSHHKQKGRYVIHFTFDVETQGYIQLECSDFYFDIPATPLQTETKPQSEIF